MKSQSIIFLLHLFFFSFLQTFSVSASSSRHPNQPGFLSCISNKFPNNTTSQEENNVIYTPKSPSYLSILDSTAQNPRYTTPESPKPFLIITPLRESHVKAAIFCSKRHGIQIRIRSGGHDVEGLSYVSQVPFIIIDLRNYQSVQVDAHDATAWVGAAATLGQVHYYIAQKSKNLGFPTGVCTTVGAAGHFTGGGYGMLTRKYGLSADNIIDALLIDVNGRVLDRKSMGEDLFWAIRGGGGASFGVILSIKVKLVYVPSKVTVFTVPRTLEQNATELVYKWQSIASEIDINLSWRIMVTNTNNTPNGKKTVLASFLGLYLGEINSLLPLIQKSFPELGLTTNDCKEMSWIETTPYFNPCGNGDDLLNRTYEPKYDLKLKSDFVKQVIPEKALLGVWKLFDEEDVGAPIMLLTAFGGIMSKIQESDIPFPHRKGNLYLLAYQTIWLGGDAETADRHVNWTRKLQKYLTPYVTKSPRQAYLNYRDLDLGFNNLKGNTSYTEAKIWGEPYYAGNFERLARVKTLVDPSNFFNFELSIPLLHH